MEQHGRAHPRDAPLYIKVKNITRMSLADVKWSITISGAPTGSKSLEVKNTFIDVRGDGDRDPISGEDPAIVLPHFSRRGVSEPALAFQRQVSGPVFTRLRTEAWSSAGTCLQAKSMPEEPEAEKGSGVTHGPHFRCQETDSGLPTTTFSPQSTVESWSSWGRQENSAACPSFEQKAHLRNLSTPPTDLPAVGRDLPCTSPTAIPSADHSPSARHLAADTHVKGTGPMPAGTMLTSPSMSDGNMPPYHWAGISTVVVLNLPKEYTQQRLIEELNRSRFSSTFNFMHMPLDTETNTTWGCAVINFKEPTLAWKFKTFFDGRKLGRLTPGEVVSVAPAMLQGFQANYHHYSRAEFNYRDPAARPLFVWEPSSAHGALKRSGGRPAGSPGASAMQRLQGVMADAGEARPQQQLPSARPSVTAAPTGIKAVVAPHTDRGSECLPRPNGGPATSAVKAATAAEQDAVVRFCPYCGGKCMTTFKFCYFCGASLDLNL